MPTGNVTIEEHDANSPRAHSDRDHRLALRLIFVARKFGSMAGGLERISIDLMNEMVRRGHTVSLTTWDSSKAVTHYPLNPQVQWLKLNLGDPAIPASLAIKAARMKRFRSFVSRFRPDAVLGFQSGAALFARVATLGMGVKIVAAERVSPDMWRYVRTDLLHRLTDIYLLALADRITVQFPSYVGKYPRILRRKMVAIHNPVFPTASRDPGPSTAGTKVLLYVARLCFQKNHALLIDAFARICDSFKDWKLVLAGDGEYENLLRDKVARSGMQERILLCGAVRDVDALYRSADLVAFPSLFEGFPNALAEALSWGLPCVGLKDTLGVNSLIQDGFNGLLVDATVPAFADGLATLMGDEARRQEMARNASSICTMYSPQRSYDLWESLLEQMASCSS